MTNYLLSIDPSIKNTGFTLGEKSLRCISGVDTDENCDCDLREDYGKPIGIKSYSFNKFTIKSSLDLKGEIRGVIIPDINTKSDNTYPGLEKFDLIIERGTFHSKNGIGYETQEHLRGFIAGQFNKLLTKDMLISPRKGQNGYMKSDYPVCKKGTKEYSINLANEIIQNQEGNITISNHDEADSLLIGGYYLNKENKSGNVCELKPEIKC